MANDYLQFSECISRITFDEEQWLRIKIEELQELEEADFEWSITPGDFWVYAEESGEPHHVAKLVQEFLKRFRPDSHFTLSWAWTCSKPRIGHFGGGAVFVTATKMKWMSTSEFLRKLRDSASSSPKKRVSPRDRAAKQK